MKQPWKRGFAASLAALLLAGGLSGCFGGLVNNVNTGEINPNTEQTEFDIMGGISALSNGYENNEVLNALQENVGIKINWETMSDSLAEQVNIRITGGQYPDAFMGVGFSNYDLARYGDDGTFLDLTPYLTEDIMPNLCAILEEHPEIRAAITQEDGKIYGLPSGEQMTTAGIGADMDEAYSIYTIPQFSMINKAWLDELGLPVPTTLDELHDALKAFQENDMSHTYYGNAAGSTIPMSTGFDEWCWGQNIRDPKVWQEVDGTYYAVIGNRTADDSGAVLLYQSADGLKWDYVRTLDACHNQYGKMWECPDFFPLDGRQVLITSPQEMYPIGLEFHAGNNAMCLIGNYDSKSMEFHRQTVQAVDYGLDFYAPQTLLAPDGRRIMIAWMQNWSTAGAKPAHCRWFGQMTLPRELVLRDGRLCQRPVRELEACRGERILHQNIPVCGEVNLPGVQGRVVDMTVTIRPTGGEGYRWFRIHVAKDGTHDTIIRYKLNESTLKIDRTRSGLPHDIVHTRSFLVRPQEGELKLRIILDRFSVEVFVTDGEQAASSVIYTRQEADAITFEADGQALIDVEKYDLMV